MTKSLIIVESPAKARTIKKFLGDGFTVKASVGHVRDLPKKRLGVEVEADFRPEYVTIRGKGKILKELRTAAAKVDRVYLAPDPDREGEAIAWHIAQELPSHGRPEVYRVLFNELTQGTIRRALEHPGTIDENKVMAQQARRILDRLVGYKLSPLLWKGINRGLSAGRVQSVALRLICDREKEIQAFTPQEYWSITALVEGIHPPSFEAKVIQCKGKKIQLSTESEASAALAELQGKVFRVSAIHSKEKRDLPPPPYITSRLQQDAFNQLRFSAGKTMALAQGLYEGCDLGEEGSVGLITYMRTDSTRVSTEAATEVRQYVQQRFGETFLPAHPPVYKKVKGAQEAHEAIRPTSVWRQPEMVRPFLKAEQFLLYRLIWSRFVASQMAPALLHTTSVDIEAASYLLRATGWVVQFQGYRQVLVEGGVVDQQEESSLPPLSKGESLRVLQLTPKQHFTQPPPRYTEATLIKDLEERGIGRPSTYATILGVIQERSYVRKEERKLIPTELGMRVTELLTAHFPAILDVEFTANLESQLDLVEEGETAWVALLRNFYGPFQQSLEKAEGVFQQLKGQVIPSGEVCDKCGAAMVIKWGRHGRFLACSAYPACRHSRPLAGNAASANEQGPEVAAGVCERCGAHMVIKTGRFGRFLACSAYPACRSVRSIPLGIDCPQSGCGGSLTERRSKRGKTFYGCSRYPECGFAVWDRPLGRPCPQCGAPFLVERWDRRQGEYRVTCWKRECTYQEQGVAASSA